MPEIPPVDRIYTDRKANNKSKKNPYLKEEMQNKNPEINKEVDPLTELPVDKKGEKEPGQIMDLEG